MKTAIGIDLGTTYSAAAICNEGGNPTTLPNPEGNPITPSVIYFERDKTLVGTEAKEMQALGDENLALLFKRQMGNRQFVLEFHGQRYSATDLSAVVLGHIKSYAAVALKREVEQAVITVPAYFDNTQREATIAAGRKASFEVLRVINEPTVAALAFGIHGSANEQKVLVYDLGGGTFDVTLVRISRKGIEVLATDGDHELGGKDWDDRIAKFIACRFEQEHGSNPFDEAVSHYDLLDRCESAKKQLSIRDSVTVSITHAGKKESYPITRAVFEELTIDLMERTRVLCEQTLQEAGVKWKKLDGVLLVGGSTRMPMVGGYVEAMSRKKPITGVDPDLAVALGAGIQAYLETTQGLALAGRKVQDVTSHSLGMVAVSGDRTRFINSIILPKHTKIPCSQTRPYQLRTTRKEENILELYMLEGESENPSRCSVLGKYVIKGIEHEAKGRAILDIEYAYDSSGVVRVKASQRSNHKELALMVEPVPDDMSWLKEPPDRLLKAPHTSVLVAVDLSGSMTGHPLLRAQEAARTFVANLDLSNSSVGLLIFADRCLVSQQICQDARALNKSIDSWVIPQEGENWVGGSNSAHPFTKALELLGQREDPRYLIVLTDGYWTCREAALTTAQACREQGIEIIAMGFGGADEAFLRKLATSDENTIYTNLDQLVSSFTKIAQVFTESGSQRLGIV